jgi:hypothetical protein
MKKNVLVRAALLCSVFTFGAVSAQAQDAPVLSPALSGPVAGNAEPYSVDFSGTAFEGLFGKTYVGGVVTGFGQLQNHPVGGDDKSWADLSNAQVFIQKVDGFLQYYIQAGAYSIPSLGVPYFKASTITDGTFGVLPQAFIKLAPTDNFSVQAGKIPTLIGAEYTFTFQNMNVQRGLLWGQENAVNRGVQVNYAAGPIAVSVAWADGFYSNRLSWLTALVSWTINENNILAVAGGGNTDNGSISSSATPLNYNNEDIYNIMYTYTNGAVTIAPYLQYSRVPVNVANGVTAPGKTLAGAVLTKFQMNENLSLAVRAEYIKSKGAAGAPNLLYGVGSKAWSLTATPTYQSGIFFGRLEGAYVKAVSATPGAAFGPAGMDKSQLRAVAEIGVLF